MDSLSGPLSIDFPQGQIVSTGDAASVCTMQRRGESITGNAVAEQGCATKIVPPKPRLTFSKGVFAGESSKIKIDGLVPSFDFAVGAFKSSSIDAELNAIVYYIDKGGRVYLDEKNPYVPGEKVFFDALSSGQVKDYLVPMCEADAACNMAWIGLEEGSECSDSSCKARIAEPAEVSEGMKKALGALSKERAGKSVKIFAKPVGELEDYFLAAGDDQLASKISQQEPLAQGEWYKVLDACCNSIKGDGAVVCGCPSAQS